MKYTIEKGDIFLCIKDYIMDDYEVAYRKGKIYKSERDGCITDTQEEIEYYMDTDDFFEHFKFIK